MPRTRWKPSSDPNGPFASRSSTIRRARTGPMRGSASMASALATSRSTGCETAFAVAGLVVVSARVDAVGDVSFAATFGGRRGPRPFRGRDFRAALSVVCAESTAASCRASAARVAGSECSSSRAARTTRTLAPSTMTPARNRSALRSAGVGMRRRCAHGRRGPSSIYRGAERIIPEEQRRWPRDSSGTRAPSLGGCGNSSPWTSLGDAPSVVTGPSFFRNCKSRDRINRMAGWLLGRDSSSLQERD